ncbi:MAG: hypothetical protein AAF799_43940 [Myxococcota bacterium]
MAQLSDEELRDAAAEAGISPNELRHALAEREGTDLARPDEAKSLMGPPARGTAATFVEGRVGRPPLDALAAVRSSIERQSGHSGHGQGDGEADIVDTSLGINYRMRSKDDGGGGALVRVDVDPTSGKSFRNLAGAGVVGVTVAMLGLAALIGSVTMGFIGMGLGALGAWSVLSRSVKLAKGIANARAMSAQALIEAEDDDPQRALPPGA